MKKKTKIIIYILSIIFIFAGAILLILAASKVFDNDETKITIGTIAFVIMLLGIAFGGFLIALNFNKNDGGKLKEIKTSGSIKKEDVKIKCKYCGAYNDNTKQKCANCGANLQYDKDKK